MNLFSTALFGPLQLNFTWLDSFVCPFPSCLRLCAICQIPIQSLGENVVHLSLKICYLGHSFSLLPLLQQG
jgi:hypothetical protein